MGPLRKGFDWVLDIPGNHDYWNGNMHNALNLAARSRFFPPLPWVQQLHVGPDTTITFHGLCSTRGATTGFLSEQWLAVGAFYQTDVRTVEVSIAHVPRPTKGKLLHVLVTHHSPAAGMPNLKGIAARGIQELRNLCSKHGLRAVLTGHDHSYAVITPPRSRLPVVEIRCSTTTQARKLLQTRSFLLHEFREDAGTTPNWYVTEWVYDRGRFGTPRPSVKVSL